MADRIDHAAEAQRLLPAQGDGIIPSRIQLAQVHATLALVEQQRIANLIAVLANGARMVSEGTGSPTGYLELHNKLDPQVREGLGL